MLCYCYYMLFLLYFTYSVVYGYSMLCLCYFLCILSYMYSMLFLVFCIYMLCYCCYMFCLVCVIYILVYCYYMLVFVYVLKCRLKCDLEMQPLIARLTVKAELWTMSLNLNCKYPTVIFNLDIAGLMSTLNFQESALNVTHST